MIEPAEGEPQHVRRRAVQPLQVIDRNQDRGASRKHPECVNDSERDRASIGRLSHLAAKERGLERPAPNRRKRRLNRLELRLEKIPKSGVGKARLDVVGAAGKDTVRASDGGTNPLPPQLCLPDPDLSLEQEPRRAAANLFQKALQCGALGHPADIMRISPRIR